MPPHPKGAGFSLQKKDNWLKKLPISHTPAVAANRPCRGVWEIDTIQRTIIQNDTGLIVEQRIPPKFVRDDLRALQLLIGIIC